MTWYVVLVVAVAAERLWFLISGDLSAFVVSPTLC